MGLDIGSHPLPQKPSALNRSDCRVVENLGGLGTQALSDPAQGRDGQVALAPLDRAVVGPVHADGVGKCLLAQMQRGTPIAYRGSDLLSQRCLVHEDETRQKLLL